MKYVCSNCDLGLKRSDCSEGDYIDCECRRWLIEELKQTTLTGFMHVLDEALEAVYENENDLRNNKAKIADWLIKGVIR